jgi:hypothetical protein
VGYHPSAWHRGAAGSVMVPAIVAVTVCASVKDEHINVVMSIVALHLNPRVLLADRIYCT